MPEFKLTLYKLNGQFYLIEENNADDVVYIRNWIIDKNKRYKIRENDILKHIITMKTLNRNFLNKCD